MQKNNHSVRNVKTLVFMALLVAMQLVLSRVFVIELGRWHRKSDKSDFHC